MLGIGLGLDRGGVKIADAGIALLGRRRLGGQRKLIAARPVELLYLADALELLGVVAEKVVELVDLEARKLPVAGVDIAAGLGVLVEHEAREPASACARLALALRTSSRFVGMPLRVERVLARVVREFDHEDHRDEDERGDEAGGRGAAATPVKADFVLFPVP